MAGHKVGIKDTRGFSLIEAVIASAVLATGLLGLIGMFGAGYRALDGGDNRTVAAKLARDKMEELRSISPFPTDPPVSEVVDGMTREWSIIRSTRDNHIWLITVDVFWDSLQGQRHNLALKSFRAY